jgi:hypothetical protein
MLFTVQLTQGLREKGICSFSAAPGGMFVPYSCVYAVFTSRFDPAVVETELQHHMPKGFRNPYMFYKAQVRVQQLFWLLRLIRVRLACASLHAHYVPR